MPSPRSRWWAATAQASRYFRDKLPIGLEGDPPTVRFVYLATEASAASFERFLRDHARLFNALPAWTVEIAHPPRLTPPACWTTTFERFVSGADALDGIDVDRLQRHFRVRRAIERLDFAAVQLDELHTLCCFPTRA